MLYTRKILLPSLFVFYLLLLYGSGFGQQDREIDRQLTALRNLEGARDASIRRPVATKPDGKPYTEEEIKKIKSLLEPGSSDLATYKNFLQQPKTGIFRLLPGFDCASKNIVRVDGDCAGYIPGGDSYSFHSKSRYEVYPDVRFNKDELIFDGLLSQEIVVQLGEVPLDKVSLASSGMKFLNDFEPKINIAEAKKQYKQITKTIESDNYKYSNEVNAAENMTYATRIVAYRSNLIRGDKRLDLTLVFRIVRKDDDKSIVILWKELKSQNAPKLVFRKDEKISDIKEP